MPNDSDSGDQPFEDSFSNSDESPVDDSDGDGE